MTSDLEPGTAPHPSKRKCRRPQWQCKNIIAHLGTQVFKRVKVGVGEKPKGYDLADYVLSRFPKDERVLMEEAFERAGEAAICMMNDTMEHAMNQFNKKRRNKQGLNGR